MKDLREPLFQFQIGSFVRLAISGLQKQSKELWGEDGHCEVRGQIVSRFLDECPGGSQRHYHIRWAHYDGSFQKVLTRHNEIELVASQAFPAAEKKN